MRDWHSSDFHMQCYQGDDTADTGPSVSDGEMSLPDRDNPDTALMRLSIISSMRAVLGLAGMLKTYLLGDSRHTLSVEHHDAGQSSCQGKCSVYF